MVIVDPARAGMASGAVNAARQLGSVLGTSTLGAVLTPAVAHRLPIELADPGGGKRRNSTCCRTTYEREPLIGR